MRYWDIVHRSSRDCFAWWASLPAYCSLSLSLCNFWNEYTSCIVQLRQANELQYTPPIFHAILSIWIFEYLLLCTKYFARASSSGGWFSHVAAISIPVPFWPPHRLRNAQEVDSILAAYRLTVKVHSLSSYHAHLVRYYRTTNHKPRKSVLVGLLQPKGSCWWRSGSDMHAA